MKPEEFCRWLQGFCEVTEVEESASQTYNAPTIAQWKSIRDHLQLVFVKVTPPTPSTTTFTLQPLPPGPVRIC